MLRLASMLQCILLLATSPLGLLFIASMVQTAAGTKSLEDPAKLLTESMQTASHGLLLAVVDMHMFGNWMFNLIAVAMFPIWLIFWALLWTDPY